MEHDTPTEPAAGQPASNATGGASPLPWRRRKLGGMAAAGPDGPEGPAAEYAAGAVVCITDNATLQEYAAIWRTDAFLTIDTEFIRETTYWPRLCLVQVAGSTHAAAIDPLAPGLDLTPLWDLLAEPGILKVMHAARQDMEIFLHRTGTLPAPLYDTQVAAMVCGYGENVGYETLVNSIAGVALDKSARFTDWSHRPLTRAQLAYAVADVTHLRTIYAVLRERILAAGREGWLAEDMARLADPALYLPPVDTVWRRLKVRSRDARFLAIVRAIAAWREETARARDVPRGRILKDDAIPELAVAAPESAAGIAALRRVQTGLNGADRAALAACIAAAKALPREDCPRLNDRPAMAEAASAAADLLRVLLKQVCANAGVAPRLVADSTDLDAFVRGEDTPLRHGWRYDLFGALAEGVLNGTRSLRFAPDTGRLVADAMDNAPEAKGETSQPS